MVYNAKQIVSGHILTAESISDSYEITFYLISNKMVFALVTHSVATAMMISRENINGLHPAATVMSIEGYTHGADQKDKRKDDM